MAPSRLRRAFPLAALAAVLLLSACGDAFRPPAAVVDGREISQQRLQTQVQELLADPGYSQQLRGPGGEGRRKELTRQLLAFLIRQEIIERYAAANGITVSGQEIDEELDRIIRQSGGREAFNQELARRNLTLARARRIVHRLVLTSKVQDLVTEKRFGNSAELRKEYDARIAEFTRVRLAHIVVPTKQAALRVSRLLSSAPGDSTATFGRLARRFSKDRATARKGGDMGWQPVAALPQVLARVVMPLRVGEVRGPVKTDAGWEILLLKAKDVIPFAEATRQILASHREQAFTEWLRQQLDRSDIEVNPRFGVLDPKTGEIQEITSTASLR